MTKCIAWGDDYVLPGESLEEGETIEPLKMIKTFLEVVIKKICKR